jgi:hypothetical protein
VVRVLKFFCNIFSGRSEFCLVAPSELLLDD